MVRYQEKAIGSRVLENYRFLKKIAKSKSENKRFLLLRNATKDQLLCLVEVAANILSSNFSLNKRQKEKLTPHANYLRSLARVRSETGARRIVQKGSGAVFPALLIPIITEATRHLLINSFGNV